LLSLQTKTGETPLHLSAEKGKTEFVEFLLQHNASLTLKDTSDQTAFDSAKKAQQKEVMSLLNPNEGGCCTIS